MNLRNIGIFCDVAQRGSFSKAAEAHRVSQSLASQAVHLLEKRLGTQLIDRSQRPLEVTPAGQVYYEGCRELLQRFRELEDRVQRMKDIVTGRVRVAAIYSVGLLQMDGYVKRFAELYPDVDIHVDYLHPDEVYERVLGDHADMGLVSFPRDGGEISSIPWQKQEMGAVVSPRHRLAQRTALRVRELDGENFVTFTSELTFRRKIDRWLKRSRISVNIVHEFDNVENIKRAVEIGAGVALLPLPTVRREVVLGSLSALRLQDADWQRPLGVIHKRHKTFSTAADKFVQLLLHENPQTCSSDSSDRSNHDARTGTGREPATTPSEKTAAAATS